MALLAGCMAGASSFHELESMLAEVGFTEISIKPEDESREFMREWTPGQDRGICGLRDLCCEPEHRQTLATSPDHFQSGKPWVFINPREFRFDSGFPFLRYIKAMLLLMQLYFSIWVMMKIPGLPAGLKIQGLISFYIYVVGWVNWKVKTEKMRLNY